MDCSEARKNMSPYIDEHLKGAVYNEFRKHIEGCLSCRKLLEDMQETLEESRKSRGRPQADNFDEKTQEESFLFGIFDRNVLMKTASAALIFLLAAAMLNELRKQLVINRISAGRPAVNENTRRPALRSPAEKYEGPVFEKALVKVEKEAESAIKPKKAVKPGTAVSYPEEPPARENAEASESISGSTEPAVNTGSTTLK